MTARLHQLTATTEKKDVELNELRRTIEKLKRAGCDAGLLKDQVSPIEPEPTYLSFEFMFL